MTVWRLSKAEINPGFVSSAVATVSLPLGLAVPIPTLPEL